jgi:hypothetical protein
MLAGESTEELNPGLERNRKTFEILACSPHQMEKAVVLNKYIQVFL